MFKQWIIFAVVALAIMSNTYALTAFEQEKDPDVKKAFTILKETDIVSFKIVNADASNSRNCWAFTKLLDSKNNTELFKELFKDAKYVSGRIYALIALHKLDQKSYQALKEQIIETKIFQQDYCIISATPTKKIFTKIEKGDYWEEFYFKKLPEYDYTTVTYHNNPPPKELCQRKFK